MRNQIARLVRQGCDLSLRQMHILFECREHGKVTVKSLFETGGSGMDKPAVSRAVQRLKDLGYVDRVEHPDDRRSVLVSLTKSGVSFVQAALKD